MHAFNNSFAPSPHQAIAIVSRLAIVDPMKSVARQTFERGGQVRRQLCVLKSFNEFDPGKGGTLRTNRRSSNKLGTLPRWYAGYVPSSALATMESYNAKQAEFRALTWKDKLALRKQAGKPGAKSSMGMLLIDMHKPRRSLYSRDRRAAFWSEVVQTEI